MGYMYSVKNAHISLKVREREREREREKESSIESFQYVGHNSIVNA